MTAPEHWIAYSEATIYGIGHSPDEARADAGNWAWPDEDPAFETMRCTPELFSLVEMMGGALDWAQLPDGRGGTCAQAAKAYGVHATDFQAARAATTTQSETETTMHTYQTDDDVIASAIAILERRLSNRIADADEGEGAIGSPGDAKKLVQLRLAGAEREHFAVIALNNRHRLIKMEILFSGTIDGSSIHPREVVKAALACNAAALICAHNHPSGDPTPSTAERAITQRLKDALALVDVRLLDHLVVGANGCHSMAEAGTL